MGLLLQLVPAQLQLPTDDCPMQATTAALSSSLIVLLQSDGGPSCEEDVGLRVYTASHFVAPLNLGEAEAQGRVKRRGGVMCAHATAVF